MEERDKGQQAICPPVIAQPLPQQPSAFRRQESPMRSRSRGCPLTHATPAHRNSGVCPQSSVDNKSCATNTPKAQNQILSSSRADQWEMLDLA